MRPPVRVGPVVFQSLEDELEPVVEHLTGHLLDAGSGTRDTAAFLTDHGVDRVTRVDLDPRGADGVAARLEHLPFADASFDSVLCNAVLEHVGDVDASMRELSRVVKPGGILVVAVPFLQPHHANPEDHRRYTAEGLGALGVSVGLDVVAVLPVHSFAQTLGWLVWEYAREKGGRARKAAAWALAHLVSRWHHRTDTALRHNANTFQAVFRRPMTPMTGAVSRWRLRSLPRAVASVETMLVPDELRLLNHLAGDVWSGAGAIVDAGCFVGGSTLALAEGLSRNLARTHRDRSPIIHAYDRFEVEEWMIGPIVPSDTAPGSSFRAAFDRNIAAHADLVEVHAGDITTHPWNGDPIEILFIDVAKSPAVCDWVSWQFFPCLVPGRSVVVQQDYLFHHWVAWLHITMELYADHFELVTDTGVNSVAFLCTKAIPRDTMDRNAVERLSLDEKVELMDRAAARFHGHQRALLVSAKAHYLEQLGA